jgi:hypothetical protein
MDVTDTHRPVRYLILYLSIGLLAVTAAPVPPFAEGKPLMALGVYGEKGDDKEHFNMPTGMAVTPDGIPLSPTERRDDRRFKGVSPRE